MIRRVSHRASPLALLLVVGFFACPARGAPPYDFSFDADSVPQALVNGGEVGGSTVADLEGPGGKVPAPRLVSDTPGGEGLALQLPERLDRGAVLVLPDSDGRLDLDEAGEGMTLAAWIKLSPSEGPPLDRTLVAKAGWPAAGWQIGLDRKNRLRIMFRPAAKPERTWARRTAEPLPVGEWTHVAMVVRTEARHPDGIAFYVNGEEAEPEMGIGGNPIARAEGPVLVAANSAQNGAPLNGTIDDLRLYDEPLSGPELFRELESVDSSLAALPRIPERWEPISTADLSPYLPFDMPPYEELVASEKKVFPHWHVFKISEDNRPAWDDAYMRRWLKLHPDQRRARQRPIPRPVRRGSDWRVRDMMLEVRLAKAMGCDGFVMNHFGHRNTRHVEDMLEAAERVDSPFKVMLALDVVGWNINPERMRERWGDPVAFYTEPYAKFGQHPFAYRYRGELVISGFMAEGLSPTQWSRVFANLRREGIETFFIPYFLNWGQNHEAYASVVDGMGNWGGRGFNSWRGNRGHAAKAHSHDALHFAPIPSQDVRTAGKKFWEAKGSEQLRNFWRLAIEGGSDWAQLLTWNDYTELTEIAPSTCTQYAIYDLNAYYIVWFKTGHRPEIVRDVLYYFHRTQFTDAQPTEGPTFKPNNADTSPPQDIIELLAFLKEPGTLRIEIGGETYTKRAPAGVTPFQVPLGYGTPRFTLLREGEAVIEMESAFTVMDKPVRGHDLLYKSGSSTRPVVPMHDVYKRYFEGVDAY